MMGVFPWLGMLYPNIFEPYKTLVSNSRIGQSILSFFKRRSRLYRLIRLIMYTSIITPFIIFYLTRWYVQSYWWKQIRRSTFQLDLLIKYWRLCMSSLANQKKSYKNPKANSKFSRILTKIPPNGDR
eukprot:UN02673